MTAPTPREETTVPARRVERTTRPDGLRVFQIVVALVGVAVFAIGLIGVFAVDFGAGFLKISGEVGDFGMSPAIAIGAVVLGAGLLVATIADQDRGSAAFVAFLVLAAGIAGLIFDDNPDSDVQVDRATAALFVVLGAIAFVAALVPWWSRREVVERPVR